MLNLEFYAAAEPSWFPVMRPRHMYGQSSRAVDGRRAWRLAMTELRKSQYSK